MFPAQGVSAVRGRVLCTLSVDQYCLNSKGAPQFHFFSFFFWGGGAGIYLPFNFLYMTVLLVCMYICMYVGRQVGICTVCAPGTFRG